ncbi:MAG: terminase large subunit [Candidatus Thermoplasmatota archaeon]|nr:terminase large subunit [Candidatus Thermoplasmatota archaeon]
MFSKEKANWAINFISQLRHTKGEWAGSLFNLQEWQKDFIRQLFGATNEDGTRQYRTAYLEIPRKNGKTELAAAIALFMLFADGEQGAEIYSAAADREQASLVFNAAATMVRNSKALSSLCKIIDSQKRIVCYKTNSFYRAISAEAYSKHGFNAHAVIYDELHVAPDRDLWDVLQTSMGARRQPLMLATTTAGYDRNTICWELHEYAKKIIDGVIDDKTFLPLIYAADQEDDWTDEAVWRKANPNLEISIKLDFLRQECQRAQEIPAYQNTFRRLHLNQWTTQSTRWIDMGAWAECGSRDIDHAELAGLRCWAGVDLSTTTDISSCAIVFEPDDDGIVHVLSYSWVPRDNIAARVRRDRVPYDTWARSGYITATDGNVIDHDWIRVTIRDEIKNRFPLLQVVGYDPWNATKWAIDLENDGVPVMEVRQGFKTMSPACKELERLIIGRKLRHDNNPVLTWAMDNLVVVQDPAGNIKPAKDKSTERIDPAVAMIIAISAMLQSDAPVESAYENRGVFAV